MKNLFALITFAMLFIACTATKVIEFSDQSYPRLDLKLSDVADVDFIELEIDSINSDFPYHYRHIPTHKTDCYIDDETGNVFIVLSHTLFKFDRYGNYVMSHFDAKLDSSMVIKEGLEYVSDFEIVDGKNSVMIELIADQNLVMLDTLLNVKKIKYADVDLYRINLKNKRYLTSTWISDRTFTKYKKRLSPSLKVRRYDKEIKAKETIKEYQDLWSNRGGEHAYHLFVEGDGGVFIQDRSANRDTVMWYDAARRKLDPRMVDVRVDSTDNRVLSVVGESDKYVFFNMVSLSLPSMWKTLGEVAYPNYYVYDKEHDTIHRLQDSNTPYGSNVYDLLDDKCLLQYYNMTKNEDTFVAYLPASVFADYKHKEGTKAAEFAASIRSRENTVLVVARLR